MDPRDFRDTVIFVLCCALAAAAAAVAVMGASAYVVLDRFGVPG